MSIENKKCDRCGHLQDYCKCELMPIGLYEKVIFDLVFAYVNKDEDLPHDFEYNALVNALAVLENKDHKSFIENELDNEWWDIYKERRLAEK
jgi:hypothetical protein